MKAISLWSGGKDSCLACYRAISSGHEILGLLNFTTDSKTNSLSHGLSAEVIRRQAEMTGIPSFQKAMPKEGYRDEFIRLIEAWKKERGIEGIVFGDIYLESHKKWVDEVCLDLGVTPIMPIWTKDTAGLMKDFIGLGFKAIIVTTRPEKLAKEYLGREMGPDLLEEFAGMSGIDPCGENGEFHTFVYDGPIFKRRVAFKQGSKTLREGRWFLEII